MPLRKCSICNEPFHEFDDLITCDQNSTFIAHRDCVDLVPREWNIFTEGSSECDEDYHGTTEEIYGVNIYDLLEPGEFLTDNERA